MRTIIYGPPGTGKTTSLLKIVEDALEAGIAPQEICFLAFTRKAANEAKARAKQKLNLGDNDLYWFRTLHSFAFSILGITKNRMMGINDYITLARDLGLYITAKGVSEDGTLQGFTKGDRLIFMENLSRISRVPLKEYWEQHPNEDIIWEELERLSTYLAEYKAHNDKVDFTDLLHQMLAFDGTLPKFKILVVDEAQDLSHLQWDVVHRLEKQADHTFIAGDDDQAIFEWAGADVQKLISMEGDKQVLPQSYRVGRYVMAIANEVVSRCSKRVTKVWQARDSEGSVVRVTELDHIDMSQGQWLLLARNSYLLEHYTALCISMGYIFEGPGSPIKGPTVQIIRLWELLRQGGEVAAKQAKMIYDVISSGDEGILRGFKKQLNEVPDATMLTWDRLNKDYGLRTKKVWLEALDMIPAAERAYFLTALRRGEKLLKEPRIKVTTIHGAKGGEADNVVILTDMAPRTWNEYLTNPDAEHRVWYVAVTRAKENLYIVSPQTSQCYDI